MKLLITGGCSFSAGKEHSGWTREITKRFLKLNPNLTFNHTGYYSQGQELIQKKTTLAIVEALDNGIDPKEILVSIMWSGTHRKAWFIDNKSIIKEMMRGMKLFSGGMCNQFLDLKNQMSGTPEFFYTSNNSKFEYNPDGGWYFTVDGSESNMEFVKDHYMLDQHLSGPGKTHISLENIVMLTNFCRLKNIKLVHQFFMDMPYQDIEQNKDHQIINYLYKQLEKDNMIFNGMFDYLHQFLNVPREQARFISHSERIRLDSNRGYFSNDGFHPGEHGSKVYCENILFPFLESKGYL
mgnify:CR=1 FL=1